MKILLYILLGYIVLTEIFGICLSISFYRACKKNGSSLWCDDVVLPLFMPILPFLFIIILIFERYGIELAPIISHFLRTDKAKTKSSGSPYDPMNDPIFVPPINTIGFNELPFIPDPNQVIYLENNHIEELDSIIKDNYDELCEWFSRNGLQFVHLPIETSPEIMRQRVMAISPDKVAEINYPEALKSDYLLDFMVRQENREMIVPCLIWLKGIEDGETVFYRIKIPKHNNMMYVFKVLGNTIHNNVNGLSETRFCCKDDDKTQEEYEKELKEAVDNFRQSAGRLAARSITQMMLHQILSDMEPTSRMVITHDYKIFLPDYENKEIEMTSLPKALYFLFLRYPEGLYLKTLQDHYKELYNIYAQLNVNGKEEKMRLSITEITNPLSNRAHENISRANKAFKDALSQFTAQKYLIEGSKGELYSIKLKRELIEWKED